MALKVKFLGAVGTVTGSCHLLNDTSAGTYHLIDCGSFQGPGAESKNRAVFKDRCIAGIPCEKIESVFLTHAHEDHCGLIISLYDNGFCGKVFCTNFTKQAALNLFMSAGKRNGRDDIETDAILRNFVAVDTEQAGLPFKMGHGRPVHGKGSRLFFNFIRTSHIVGCVAIEFVYNAKPEESGHESNDRIRILFGADTGSVIDPESQGTISKKLMYPVPESQTIVLESTYGGKQRAKLTFEERLTELAKVLCDAAEGKESPTIIIPAFSLQRLQEITLDIASLFKILPELTHQLWINGARPEIINISRMASGYGNSLALEFKNLDKDGKPVFANHKHPLLRKARDLNEMVDFLVHLWCRESIEYSEDFPIKHTDKYYGGKKGVCQIILGSNGMCAGGSIVGALKEKLVDPETTVLLTGYQAWGTPGRCLQELGECGKVSHPKWLLEGIGVDVTEVKARVRHIGSLYSSHADSDGLVRFALEKDMPDKTYQPVSIVLVHGERESRNKLREHLQTWDRENSEKSRGLVHVYCPEPGAPWYDCEKRAFETPERDNATELLAIAEAKLSHLRALIQRVKEGEIGIDDAMSEIDDK